MANINRRQAAALIGGTLLAPLAAPSVVKARSTRPVFIIVPYASGGSIDNLMRSIAKGMSEALEQPVLVDNKPGANGIVGSQYVARAPKDGSVLLAGGTGPISLNVLLRKSLPYKLEDFASVAMLCSCSCTRDVSPTKMRGHSAPRSGPAAGTPSSRARASSGVGMGPRSCTPVSRRWRRRRWLEAWYCASSSVSAYCARNTSGT